MERIKAYQAHTEANYGDVAYLGIKGAFDFYWGPDNRGTNVFKGKTHLTAFGSPFPNIAAIEDEYHALGIKEPFEDYYNRHVASEYLQLIGRQRCHRFPQKNFVLDIVATDINLDYLKDFGINVINRSIDDVCPQASGDRVLQFAAQFADCLKGFQDGAKINQKALAAKMGISQNRFSELIKAMVARFDGFGDSWHCLKEKISKSLYSLYKTFDKILQASSPPDSGDPDPAAEYLIWAAMEAAGDENPDKFQNYLDQLDKKTRELTLGLLLRMSAIAV
jgi:hypothetical protein